MGHTLTIKNTRYFIYFRSKLVGIKALVNVLYLINVFSHNLQVYVARKKKKSVNEACL